MVIWYLHQGTMVGISEIITADLPYNLLAQILYQTYLWLEGKIKLFTWAHAFGMVWSNIQLFEIAIMSGHEPAMT